MLLFSTLISCKTVQIKDQEWCGDKGAGGAWCFHTFKQDERELDRYEWEALRFGWICTSPQSFGEMKSEQLQLCKISKKCTYEEIAALEAVDAQLRIFENASRFKSAY